MSELLLLASNVALEAGVEIMNIYQSDFEVEFKADESPLTLADQRADRIIKTSLQSTHIPILSEEGLQMEFKERKLWDYFWMVDPLDGTKEFVKKNGEFTVNIALIHKNTPVLGVVFAPFKKWLYYGSNEVGAYKVEKTPGAEIGSLEEGKKLPLMRTKRPYTIVASRSHLNDQTRAVVDSLNKEHPNLSMISAGSSLKLCMVAEGSADLYPRLAPTMEWDTAAGDAICRFAGCEVIHWESGEPLKYNKEDLHNPWFKVARYE